MASDKDHEIGLLKQQRLRLQSAIDRIYRDHLCGFEELPSSGHCEVCDIIEGM